MGEVWNVHAAEEACDIAMRAPGAGRVATDEVMVTRPIPEDIRLAIEKLDPDAMIRDAAEGWAEVVLDPSDARDVFVRLSELQLPPVGFVQGDVARVAVRAFVEGDRISLFVPAFWEAHLLRRVAQERARP